MEVGALQNQPTESINGHQIDHLSIEDQQAIWKKLLTPQDFEAIELCRALREQLGINAFIQAGIEGAQWFCDAPMVVALAQKARAFKAAVKVALRFTIHPQMMNLQIVHELILQLGLKVTLP